MTPFELGEYIKCAKDPIYFLNTYGYIYNVKSKQVDRLTCFDYQEELVNKIKNFQNNIVLKSRQMGISVISAGYVVWTLLFKLDQRILIVANDGAGAVRFLDTVKQFLQFLPPFLYDSKKDDVINNQKFLSIKSGNWVKAVASGKQAGRGEALTLLILDETAFIENAEEIWMGAGIALTATQGKCVMISCVPKDTMVFTDKGIKTIGDFVVKDKSGGYEISEYNIFGKDRIRTGNLFFNNGFHKTKILKTTNSEFEGTFNHKLWACREGNYDWYKIEELKENDFVSIQYGMEIFGNNDDIIGFNPTNNNKILNKFNPKKITKDIAYLIGLYISEGSTYKVKNEKGDFIGGSVTITCGDDISAAIINAGLKFSSHDNLHYSIGSKNFIEFLEYIGFDLTKKAKEKIIPSRLLEMSRDNIVSMLRGIFDGDGYSRKDKGYIGISLNSKTLIMQIRMLLLNFGILTDYYEVFTKITKKVKVQTINHRISANAEFSKVFYKKIGFNFNRKQNNYKILEKYNLERKNPNDIIPFSLELIKKMVTESNYPNSFFKKNNVCVNGILNKTKKYKTNHISRRVFLKMFELCKEKISNDLRNKIEKILANDLKWNKINEVKYSENETYDFSLPDDKNDFWCHSVIYNGLLGHQTPNGTGNLYHTTWVGAEKDEGNFVATRIHWTQHPIYNIKTELKRDEHGREFWTSPWYEAECDRMNQDRIKIAQELDLSFEGSRALVIDSHIIAKYKKAIIGDNPICHFDYLKSIDEVFVDIKTNFAVYKKPVHGKNYIIGADVGRGDGSDYSTIQVIDADELEQVAEYQGKIPPDLFATIIKQAAIAYNMAYVVIECNSFGYATSLALKNQLQYDPNRIYHSKTLKKLVNHHYGISIDENGEIPGFQTTQTTRPLVISSLGAYMREGKIILHSSKLINEFDTFIYNGIKPEHAVGYHDDLIFALGIALFIRDTQYQNVFLSKEYFTAMNEAFTHVQKDNKSIYPEDTKTEKMNTPTHTADDDLSWLLGSTI